MPARSACVVAGASPDQVRAHAPATVTIAANRLGTLVTGPIHDLPIDLAYELPGPVYDVMYDAHTGWLAVTIYRGETQPTRWDNRPDEECGYPRVEDVLGATTPRAILEAIGMPADVIGYAEG